MWDLAVREEDFGGINDMLARYVGRAPLSMRLVPAAARSDTAAIRVLLEEGRALESRQLQIAARYAASYLQDLVSKNLKEYENILSDHDFFRVHQSHLISLTEVVKYVKSDEQVILENGDVVKVSHSRKESFLNKMKEFQ
jgi:DNA-binding LytR/AlgR family response regulator